MTMNLILIYLIKNTDTLEIGKFCVDESPFADVLLYTFY